jgi:hypothetical protein
VADRPRQRRHFLGASSSPAAIAGYPLIDVPAGEAFGLPVGITFMGTAFSEPKLIKLASGFEQATRARRKPSFLPTLPLDGPRDQPRFRSAGRRHKFDLERTPQLTHEKPVMI